MRDSEGLRSTLGAAVALECLAITLIAGAVAIDSFGQLEPGGFGALPIAVAYAGPALLVAWLWMLGVLLAIRPISRDLAWAAWFAGLGSVVVAAAGCVWIVDSLRESPVSIAGLAVSSALVLGGVAAVALCIRVASTAKPVYVEHGDRPSVLGTHEE